MTHHPWCLVVPIVMVLLAPVCQGDLEQDREALLTLYNATGGSEWTDNDGWATNSSDMSSWYGLSINETGSYVSRVSLGKNNLQGDLPPEIGNLTAVEDMYLGINSLTGPIPPELGKLQNLEVLDLNTNFLTGSIPKELGDLAVLEELYLFGNDLDGEIPPQLGNLEQMENLLLHDNRLTGEIPTSLGNLTWMTALNLADNRLSGEIPEEIGQLVVRGSLSWVLWLQNNYFSVIAAITGGVVGGVAILAGVLIFCCMRRRKLRKDVSRGASAPSEHDVRPASSSAAAGKVFLPLSGALSDTYGDEEQASYSWTRGKTDMNGDGGGGSSSSPGPLLTTEATARLRASASSFSALKSINTDDDNADPLPPASATTTAAKANNGLSLAESTAQQSASGTVAEGVGTTVLDIATAALAGAEALAQQSFFPGVREAASVVAGLVGLASDHKNNGKESEKRARWCRSIVHTLERAAEVLGKEAKAGKGDSQAVHVLLDDVQDSIADLLQIIESYKSKNALSKVFVSTLCKKRQEEAEVAINAAVQRLQLGLQVRVGQNLASVGEAVQEGLDLHRRASQESEMVTKKKRRQHRLDQLEIPASDVEVTNEVLGRGGFGTVYLADLHGLNAAAKVVSREHQRQRRMFMRELEAMKRLRGPHTVTIYGAVTSLPDRLVLVMELLQGGDLRHRLKKAKEPLEEKVLRKIVRDVCCGMAFLHAKATVHGDLKSANVLFDATGRAKIADFGTSLWTQHSTRLATYTTKPREMVGMSLPWAAPEVLNRRGSSFEGDVYSFGVVVWECLSREVPWKGVAGVDKLVLAVTAGERPPIPENAPHDIAALAEACWVHDPAARPTFKKNVRKIPIRRSLDVAVGIRAVMGIMSLGAMEVA
ncbi:Two component regulator three Y domain protein/ leucine rich repeat-containing protein [Ectocarpus siliculosus]|uniref:Two component regulator three Y domain protein/ leucine rich repeat-containing protein n=1 Tax=Ectocarpus siliculosus TaxID=2880 RepID=D8LTP7_ECTSI|nr:Two component regulator three Y domain protein/ leucine rich repeat-containing protein [Ectocarpus siliculosus]|eukprot:CBN73944.1 Two component regulator three Y domain protein/ leucine rich repeat-containing protein [Ectocarpus siliculosus]